jgi:hypothetical protein
MSNQFLKLRRSAVQGKIPETSSLDLGELAINTFDGQLFLKKSGSQGEIVTVVGSTGSFTGSFFGNGAGLTSIPASGITGLNLSRIATGSITASVSNTDISASFRVTSGSNTLFNVTKDGRTWIGAGSFVDAAYQLDIQGTSRTFAKFTVGGTRVFDNRLTIINDGNQGTISISEYLQNETTLVKHWIRSFGNGLTFLKVGGAATNMTFVVGTDSGVTNYDGITINDFTGNLTSSSAINFFTQGRGFDARYTARISSTNNVTDPYVTAYPDLRFWTGNTNELPTLVEAMRLDSYQALLIGTTGSISSSILTLGSTTRGFLPTRTNSTASITSPAQGLLTYITASGDVEGLWQYRTGSNGWVQFLHNSSSIPASSVVGLNLSRISTGSITASVSTDISASFRLTSGSNTLLNITREGYVWIGNGSFTNQAYQLDVQGTSRFANEATFTPPASSTRIATLTNSGLLYFANGSTINTFGAGAYAYYRATGEGGTNDNFQQAQSFLLRNNSGRMSVANYGGDLYLGSVGNNTIFANASTEWARLLTGTNGHLLMNTTTDVWNSMLTLEGSASYGGQAWLQPRVTNPVMLSISSGLRGNAFHFVPGPGVSSGSGYVPGTYSNVPFISSTGIGTGSLATFVVGASGGVSNMTITYSGYNYAAGDILTVSNTNLGGSGTGFSYTVVNASTHLNFATAGMQVFNTTDSSNYVFANSTIGWQKIIALKNSEFNTTSSLTSAGITTISQLSTSSYTSCFYNYTVASASNARSGQVMTVWNGNTIRYTEVVTTDIGDTNQVIVSASLASGFVRLQVSASSGWTFKNISNLL